MKTENSCGRRGCELRIILPYDGKPEPLHARVLQKRNDTKAVLSLPRLSLDQMEVKKAA